MNGVIGLQIPRVTMDQESDQAKAIVFETLKSASSQNVDVLKPAEEKLKQWEAQPGFYSVLVVSSQPVFGLKLDLGPLDPIQHLA